MEEPSDHMAMFCGNRPTELEDRVAKKRKRKEINISSKT